MATGNKPLANVAETTTLADTDYVMVVSGGEVMKMKVSALKTALGIS